MKREVAVLSGNFRGELSPLDGGGGIRRILLCVQTQETHKGVYEVGESSVRVEK